MCRTHQLDDHRRRGLSNRLKHLYQVPEGRHARVPLGRPNTRGRPLGIEQLVDFVERHHCLDLPFIHSVSDIQAQRKAVGAYRYGKTASWVLVLVPAEAGDPLGCVVEDLWVGKHIFSEAQDDV